MLSLLFGPRPGLAQGPLIWQQNLNGTANDLDEAFSVAVDNKGNVLAAGASANTGTLDFTVAKFDRSRGPRLFEDRDQGDDVPCTD